MALFNFVSFPHQALSGLTHLHSLGLPANSETIPFSPNLFWQDTLTHLSLVSALISPAISILTRLRSLSLSRCDVSQPLDSFLPTSVSRLRIHFPVESTTNQWQFTTLTNLRNLWVKSSWKTYVVLRLDRVFVFIIFLRGFELNGHKRTNSPRILLRSISIYLELKESAVI